MLINGLIIILIILLVVVFIYKYMKKSKVIIMEESKDLYELGYLVEEIKKTFNDILRANLVELNLNRHETNKREKNKLKLRKALKNCSYGDIGAKEFIKEYIKEILQKKFNVNEHTINKIIPFDNEDSLNIQDQFEILLCLYKERYGLMSFEKIILKHQLDKLHFKDEENHYEISKEDIYRIYRKEVSVLNFMEKLDVVAQRIYQLYKGHGVIDFIRDMKIDGVSGGVSGLSYELSNTSAFSTYTSYSYDSIWIFFQGKTIHLSFLGFGSQKELERVCKNIYRYNNPGQLSQSRGYIANDMKDGSRVVVVRPPFAESWAFFIRKFDSVSKRDIKDLITDKNSDIPISLMKWIVKGCRVVGITGSQGSGKTTLLMSLIKYIHKTYTLRIQELVFELNLRSLYPDRNILTFRETDTVSGQEGLDIQKKTDGTVNILGEVATAAVSAWLIQMSQVASLFTMFTHHAKTSKDLVISMRNALLVAGGFTNEKIAEDQVASTINFDIHMNKGVDGHRYIERITEIIPISSKAYPDKIIDATKEFFDRTTERKSFDTVDIVVFEEDKYILKNFISERSKAEIMKYLTAKEKQELCEFFAILEEER